MIRRPRNKSRLWYVDDRVLASRFLAALAFAPILAAQTGPGVQQPSYKNELLDNLAGLWSISGTQGDRPIHGVADAEWVMGLYLRLHEKTDGLESVVHVGYDNYDKRLVAFRLDSISVRGAETNGYGLQEGNSIKFTFEYPTSTFRETWTWDPQSKGWQFLVESKGRRETAWKTISTFALRRLGGGRGPGIRGGGRGPQGLPPQ